METDRQRRGGRERKMTEGGEKQTKRETETETDMDSDRDTETEKGSSNSQ